LTALPALPALRASFPTDGGPSTQRLHCGAAALAGRTSKGDERGRRSAGELEAEWTLRPDKTEFHASPATCREHRGRSGVLWQDLANVSVQRPRGAPRLPPHTPVGSALIQLQSKR